MTLQRAMRRDLYLFGTPEKTAQRYRKRYIPGQRLCLSQVVPDRQADVMVHNDDSVRAHLNWAAPGRDGH